MNQKNIIEIDAPSFHFKLKDILIFEIKSWYGRNFMSKTLKVNLEVQNFLHLGCSRNILREKDIEWINADFFVIAKPWNYNKIKIFPDWMIDLRFPLDCHDEIFDGVFTEHTLEHLDPHDALNLLKEVWRTMKPDSWLRLTVPDLSKYVSYYCKQQTSPIFSKQWGTGAEALRALTQSYGHMSLWDNELIFLYLQEVGFVNIHEVSFMQGTDKRLLKDKEERQWETLYIEAQKI